MDFYFKRNKKLIEILVFMGIIVLSMKIFGVTHPFKFVEIRVVKAKYEKGLDKEVWIYKRNIFGKKKKLKEIVYFENGKIKVEINYKKGRVNGWARIWHKNGSLHVEATYKNDKCHGVRVAYHKNGKVFCRAEYNEGKLLRKKNWDEEGNEIYLPLDRE